MRNKARPGWWLTAPAVLVLLLGAILAGRSQAPQRSERQCAAIRTAADHFVLQRTAHLPPSQPRTFEFPAVAAVRGTRPARAVADVLCRLPSLQANTAFGCSVGISYVLTFYGRNGRTDRVSFQSTGCDAVYGLGGGRLRLYLPYTRLWAVLGRALGVRQAGHTTFEGKGMPLSP